MAEQGVETESRVPPIFEMQLFHQSQRFSWDCGISCVMMILPPQKRAQLLTNFHDVCSEEGFGKSTWTIDLCYLLKRYEIQHLYCTITLGVHPGYRGQAFYDKLLDKDEDRVKRRFAEADKYGIRVRQMKITTEDIVRHLAKSGPIILLTNNNLLNCEVCKGNRLAMELRNCFPWSISYHGHYIVLCGYDYTRQKFSYRNPAFRNRICIMSFEMMDEARKSYGTDEDAILIYYSWS
ncbi:protein GUCD1 [Ischnura elegans]|uniref:protein GUCD1 n=1 Tax=Ischnura elegans TaxID=197161 RepID=UPI001ED8928A|nr:protein GUCD1 [Ischnura elegans]XP_046385929.1 protein GUCD1 [Ischnura elegans]